MKMKRHLAILVATSALLFSCDKAMEAPGFFNSEYDSALNSDAEGTFNAIVTVKKTPTDTVFFQLNDSTTVYPSDYQSMYTRMERIICNMHARKQPAGSFKYTCWVEWAEPLEEGTVSSSAKGEDPIDVLDDWMTSVEDGYLTIHYDAMWGKTPKVHSFSVVTGSDPADPYQLILRHNANGDAADLKGDGLVCFDINSLPSTGGQYKKLTLKWNSLEGRACERQFKFKTRE